MHTYVYKETGKKGWTTRQTFVCQLLDLRHIDRSVFLELIRRWLEKEKSTKLERKHRELIKNEEN